VIVVGNVVVGGAGKTPTVIAIVRHLQQQGHRPGVISRGYGRKIPKAGASATGETALEVRADTPAELSGDEPLLIQHATQVPVFVARQRVQAARALLAHCPDTTVVICDDGLQHLALHADISVVVFDERGVGNGWLLPAGLLREPWPGRTARRVDLVLHATAQGPDAAPLPTVPCPPHVNLFRAHKQLATHARSAGGQLRPLAGLTSPGEPPLMALAGIAKPQGFFDMLHATGLQLAHTLPLADHQPYDDFLKSKLSNEIKRYRLICTEKDAVKLFPLLNTPPHPEVEDSVWTIPLALTPEPAFFDALDERLSSPNGLSTA
jgi:tetraacyldisaccharide 4'-kinase